MKVMFKCLWKNCEKVLSTSSGIQRHIRTIHLGYVFVSKVITHKWKNVLDKGLSGLFLPTQSTVFNDYFLVKTGCFNWPSQWFQFKIESIFAYVVELYANKYSLHTHYQFIILSLQKTCMS